MEIVDAHQHVGTLQDAMPKSDYVIGEALPVDVDAARRIKLMDDIGISWAVLQPSHDYLRPDGIRDTMRVNDRMAAYRTAAPGRFCAVMGVVEPLHGERSLPEIERCKRELNLNGIAWHHRFAGCYIDSRWMWPYLERMQELGLVPLIHVNAESSLEAPWRLQRLAKEYPDLTFIGLDGLWSFERARQILDNAPTTPNVIWDMGGPNVYVGVEEWVKKNGADTLCFSADIAYAQESAKKPSLLIQLENARISVADKEKILGGNMRRVFGVDGQG